MGRILTIRSGHTLFALDLRQVRHVLHLPELQCPMPLPSFVAGYFFLDRVLVTVLDLASLLGFGALDPSPYSPLILLQGQPAGIALLVEEVPAIGGFTELAAMAEDASFNGVVKGRCGEGPDAPFLIDPNRLLLEQERQRLHELTARATERLAAGLESEA